MKQHREIIVSLGLVAVLLIKFDPFHWLMPTEIQMLVLCLFAAGFALYAGLIFREKARDEREQSHLYLASRLSYMVGVITLSVIIVIQDLLKQVDPWMMIALAIMILTKLFVLIHARIRH